MYVLTGNDMLGRSVSNFTQIPVVLVLSIKQAFEIPANSTWSLLSTLTGIDASYYCTQYLVILFP